MSYNLDVLKVVVFIKTLTQIFMSKIAFWLLIIGGVNWLLVGLFQNDLFGFLGMSMMGWFPRLVYILVGVSALVSLKPKGGNSMPM